MHWLPRPIDVAVNGCGRRRKTRDLRAWHDRPPTHLVRAATTTGSTSRCEETRVGRLLAIMRGFISASSVIAGSAPRVSVECHQSTPPNSGRREAMPYFMAVLRGLLNSSMTSRPTNSGRLSADTPTIEFWEIRDRLPIASGGQSQATTPAGNSPRGTLRGLPGAEVDP
jgi:hypothetical protein